MKLRRRRRGMLGTALGGRATGGGPATVAGGVGGATLAASAPETAGGPAPGGAASAGDGNRKRTLATLALGLLAVATAVGSGADFTARTANPSNTFSAGTLSMENSKDGTAILNADNLKPGGDPKTGGVDIKNTGSIDGAFTLTRDQLTSTDANNDNPSPFASKLAVGVV